MKNFLYRLLCICLCLCLPLALWACDDEALSSSDGEKFSETSSSFEYGDSVSILERDSIFTERDLNGRYDEDAVSIILDRDTFSCLSEDVSINGSQITISSGGDYIISGSSDNCTIVVDAQGSDKVCLVLDGASIGSSGFAPIYIKKAKKVFILAKGVCRLSSNGAFAENELGNADAVICSKDDLTLQGDGELTVSSAQGHGISCKGALKICSLSLNIDASSHAIIAKDSISTHLAKINSSSKKDALHAENNSNSSLGFIYLDGGALTLKCASDALDASGAITISGSKLDITTGENAVASSDSSKKGIKATGDIAILGGDVSIKSADDAIHSSSSLAIFGGNLTITSLDDGIHADALALISGGDVSILRSYEGIEGQRVAVTGGKLSIVANDDGINAGGGKDSLAQNDKFDQAVKCAIDILGGEIYVNAKGDGIDSNGTISVSGGITVVEGPTNNKNGPFDYDSSASATGGIFVAIGSPGMAMNFSEGTQGAILHNFENTVPASSELKIYDGDTLILSHTSQKQFVSVLVSAPNFKVGCTYKIVAGEQSVEITLKELIHNKGYR